MSVRAWIAGLALALLTGLGGGAAMAQAASPSATEAQAIPQADRDYILGPSDVIEVNVLGRGDFNVRARIDERGRIELPYIGSVEAANRTTTQLADDITGDLERGGFFSHPVLSVQIVSYASRYVTVLGEVEHPGLIPVDRAYHLSEILARVGGVKEGSADYLVLVGPDQKPRHYSVTAMATGDPSNDPYVQPGDRIFSPKAEVFYISGEVRAPGAYPIDADMTFREAVARAGGVNQEGSLGKVKLTRGNQRPVKADLNAKVQPGDIIVVGARLF